MTTPETVGQFADAVRAAVDAERERIKAAVIEELGRAHCGCDEAYTSRGLIAPDCPRHNDCEILADEILNRIEEGR